MPSPALRAPTAAALAARVSPASRRPFHSTPCRFNGNGNGAKPSEESITEQNGDSEMQNGTETAGGRSRSSPTGSQRARRVRRQPAAELPPVKLPNGFIDRNVSIHNHNVQPILPKALVEDAKHPKKSRLYAAQGPGTHQTNQTLEWYFDTVVNHLLTTEKSLAEDLERSQDEVDSRWNSSDKIAGVVRLWDVILDSAWHLTDSLYPARQAEYIYKTRPFWWWHLYKDLDPRTHQLRDLCCRLELALDNHLHYVQHLDSSLAHAISDLPVDTFTALRSAVSQEMHSTAPQGFDSKNSKRPITVLALSGYAGKSIAESTAEHIAWLEDANIIHLDAQDLSLIVGSYLGQNWAYSRGSLSMLGFRAAELNGKLVREGDGLARIGEEDDADSETPAGISLRTGSSGNLWEDLQELKPGSLDTFNRWESLKIDKVLDNIIRSSDNSSSPDASTPLVIHIHDFIELSMTMEGTFLLNRLRSLVDAAWQQGRRVAIFGTSSSEQPSEAYQNAISELAHSDFVVTRHLKVDGVEGDSKDAVTGKQTFDLQKTDIFFENARNIDRMLHSLDPETKLTVDDWIGDYLHNNSPRFAFMRDSILPIPEIYHLANSIKSSSLKDADSGPAGLLQRFVMGKLRQQPGQQFLDDESPESKPPSGDAAAGEEAKTETRAPMKLNEYERRISSGQINKESLRITFADVHAPAETISSLKLLTSLALVRPDAFAYGVLASDKIPGCLLYGPPGTGKTMLAKAVAKESGANMLEVSGATINDKWVGESEKLIRAVFTLAKKLSPCVVFIDEADSLLANRSMFSNRASHREHINQFLKEWDGMEETNAFIMVATNRPFDLDDAVLRRLPRKLLVDLPLKDDRGAILKLLLKDETLDGSVSLEDYAKRTAYYSGSDLKNVCVAAAMAAVEEENLAAANHTGPEPFSYPERRILRSEHFENALKQIPASISEDMVTLKQIRKFDEEYGSRKRKGKKSSMGFGVLSDLKTDSDEARIRPGAQP